MASDLTQPDPATSELDVLIDALYAEGPDTFISLRNEFAKALRRAKRRDDATIVAKLAKPTPTAAALNRFALARPDAIDRLRAAGRALRNAQQAMLEGRGGTKELQAASEWRRQEIRSLLSTLRAAEPGAPAADDDWARTLEVASVDDEAGDALAKGRLARAVRSGVGIDGTVTTAVTAQGPTATGGGNCAPDATGPFPGPDAPDAPDAPDDADDGAAETERRAAAEALEQAQAIAAETDVRLATVELAVARTAEALADRRHAANGARELEHRAHQAVRDAADALRRAEAALRSAEAERDAAERSRAESNAEVTAAEHEHADAQRRYAELEADAARARDAVRSLAAAQERPPT